MPDSLIERLRRYSQLLRDPFRAEEICRRYLLPEERERVGPLAEAYVCNGGLVGIWMQAKGLSRERAIVELIRLLGWIPDGEYNHLLREIGEAPTHDYQKSHLPVWKRDVFELWFDGELIKRIQRPIQAENQICVLNAFQEVAWREGIDNPLLNRDKLRDTVRRLNERLERIRFQRDGTGNGIRWSEIPAP